MPIVSSLKVEAPDHAAIRAERLTSSRLRTVKLLFAVFYARWPSEAVSGGPAVDHRNQPCQPALGWLRGFAANCSSLPSMSARRTVAKYMARNRRPPSQGWKTFLRNHANGIASIDLFVVPSISFQLLYGLLILKHRRREILCLSATAHPSAEWISRQLTEAYGWEEGPCYLVPRSGHRLW